MSKDYHDLETVKAWLGTGSINIFGRPFAGKDTQGHRLAEIFGAVMISSGDIFRKSKELSEEERTAINKGGIASAKRFYEIIPPFLSQVELDGLPLILSSVGRLIEEAEVVIRVSEEAGHPIKAAVALNVDEAEVWERWAAAQAEGDREPRHDDTAESLGQRLLEYNNRTQPVIEFYRQAGLLVEVSTTAPKDEVTDQIIQKLTDFSLRTNHASA